MAGKLGFWTRERLKELARLQKLMTTMELARHFDRDVQAIIDAIAFHHQDRKLRISRTTQKGVITTVYKAGYARGTIGPQDDESGDDDSGLVCRDTNC